jgi:predicted permease
MTSLIRDLKYGIRNLAKRPGFTAIAVLTLALGIGVNAALFSVFDAFVLKPLPLKDPGSLVNFNGANAKGERYRLVSYLDFLDYRSQNHTLADVIAWNKVRVTLGEAPPNQDDSAAFAEGYEYLFGQIVSANYFAVLGAEMALGSGFQAGDDERAVIVLSHGCWQRRFNSDPAIVGKTITLQGAPFTVVGVTAKEFVGTTPDVSAFWSPLANRDLLIREGGWGHKVWRTDRATNVFTLLGRLKPGVTLKAAENDLRLVTGRLAQSFPAEERMSRVNLGSAATFVTLDEDALPLVLPLLIGFGLVLLIACANVANLLLARSTGRHREIAVRIALGASRRQIIQQLITESVLLAVAGGVLGLLLAVWTLSVLYPIVLSSIPLPADLTAGFSLNLTPDWRVFGFTLLIASLAGIGAGLAPALQASKPELAGALKNEGSTFGQHLSQSRLRSMFVVLQIALCMSLLVAAGLLVRNLQSVRTIDTGMTTKSVFAVAVGLSSPAAEKPDAAREGELRRQLLERLRATPGVVAVSEASQQPLSGEMKNTAVILAGQSTDFPLEARFNFVSPDYFEALSIGLLRGRGFTADEASSRAPVVVVSEATAQRYWPGADPIGQRIGVAAWEQKLEKSDDSARHTGETPVPQNGDSARHTGGTPVPHKAAIYRRLEVIGVARDTRSRWVWEKDETFIYLPLPPGSPAGQFLIVRTQNDPASVMSSVRSLGAEIDPALRTSVRRIDESMAFQMAPFRAIAWISGVLGMLALVLASVGLYGVMSFVVAQRTREIGIRVALGAHPSEVVRMFLFQGLRLTGVGIFAGIVGGALISRLLAAVLVDLSSLDAVTFASVSAFLTIVAMLAIFVPARRAAKVDPLVALRYE